MDDSWVTSPGSQTPEQVFESSAPDNVDMAGKRYAGLPPPDSKSDNGAGQPGGDTHYVTFERSNVVLYIEKLTYGEMAYHGHRVKLYDSNISALNSAYQRIEEDKKCLTDEGLLTHRNYIGQILCMSRLEETVNDADFIIECITENIEAKKDLFERVSHLCKQQAIIATSTLRLSLKEITERTTFKERTLGLRFLFPVHYIPEVEITPGPCTSTQVIEKVRILIEKMGKTLFFRSGGEPLILSEEQREERLKARQEQINNSSGVAFTFDNYMPALSHRGNHPPVQDDDSQMMKSEEKECAICMDRNRDCLLCPCHHLVTCYKCSSMLLNRRDACPICRTDITELINVYLS